MTEQPAPAPSPDPEQILALKDRLLECWKQLPSEHQATMGLVLVNSLVVGEWGVWFTEALDTQYGTNLSTPAEPSPMRSVSRDDLRESFLTEEQIAQLTDEDLTRITQKIHKHLMEDVFPEEIPYVAEHILALKQEGK
jgi:hypothetical protein